MAAMAAVAFSKARRVRMSRGRIWCCSRLRTAAPTSRHSTRFWSSTAGIELLCGSIKPIASIATAPGVERGGDAAAAGPGAGGPQDLVGLGCLHRADRYRRLGIVHVQDRNLAAAVHAGQDRAAADDQAGIVHPGQGHGEARAVLVAVVQPYQRVVAVGADHAFGGVGDQVPRRQAGVPAFQALRHVVADSRHAEREPRSGPPAGSRRRSAEPARRRARCTGCRPAAARRCRSAACRNRRRSGPARRRRKSRPAASRGSAAGCSSSRDSSCFESSCATRPIGGPKPVQARNLEIRNRKSETKSKSEIPMFQTKGAPRVAGHTPPRLTLASLDPF